jgi:glycosyltransferase involved in cell wall biosynthesis
MHMTQLIRKAIYTLRYRGWRDFYVKARRKLFPPKIHQPAWNQTYTAEALTLVQWLDFTPEDLSRSKELMALHQGPLHIQTINWYVPQFEHAYYGGIHTILRFASRFAQRYNVQNTFMILGNPNSSSSSVYLERIATVFPSLSGSTVVVIRSDADLPKTPPADACVASLWSTAYYVLKFNNTKRKFYFLQDFEPMFYPAGSTSAQVEATYRFGFYGLTNTITLKKHYEEDYQGTAMHFTPCVDTSVFYPHKQRNWTQLPYQVFFYARPNYWRNGFELGAIALRKVKERFGQNVRIVSAGQNWNPGDYGLDGVVESLGLLSYHETAELYRSCDVGLAMMFTRHPSYLPFEFMASGCLVVSNVNSATLWLLQHEENCLLTLPSASCVADTIIRGLEDVPLRQRVTAAAYEMIGRDFVDWEGQIDKAYKYMALPIRT